MRIAIVGSNGYIAKYLIDVLNKQTFIEYVLKIDQIILEDVEYLNLLNPESFNYEVLDSIDFVLFTAAISSPDQCAEKYDLSWGVNVVGTSHFIGKAINKKCKVLFFSSDAVYGKDYGFSYDEKSATNPHTAYGKMKKSVEDEFKDNPNFKVLRLSYVISAQDKFLSYCINCMLKKEKAEIYHPFYRNCIARSDVGSMVLWMIKQWNQYTPFVLNAAGNELVSRVRVADEINRYFIGALQYDIIYPSDLFYKNREAVTQTKSLYLEKYNVIEIQSITEKIRMELEEINL